MGYWEARQQGECGGRPQVEPGVRREGEGGRRQEELKAAPVKEAELPAGAALAVPTSRVSGPPAG